MSHAKSAERVVRDIQRKPRRRFSAEEKIRIVLEGLRGEESIATLCRERSTPIGRTMAQLQTLRGIGPIGARVLTTEVFAWR